MISYVYEYDKTPGFVFFSDSQEGGITVVQACL